MLRFPVVGVRLVEVFNRPINPHPPQNATEQSILDAAEHLFLERGFARTSTTMIAKAAGCNQALVHYYFRTKDNLFESIFERKARSMFSGFLSYAPDAPFEEVVAGLVRTHFDILSRDPRIPSLIVNELTTNPQRLKSLRGRFGEIPQGLAKGFQARLDREAAAGTIRPTKLFDLFLTTVSLNAFLFLSAPIFRNLLELDEKTQVSILQARRDEHVRLILASLRPERDDGDRRNRKPSAPKPPRRPRRKP